MMVIDEHIGADSDQFVRRPPPPAAPGAAWWRPQPENAGPDQVTFKFRVKSLSDIRLNISQVSHWHSPARAARPGRDSVARDGHRRDDSDANLKQTQTEPQAARTTNGAVTRRVSMAP